MGKQKYTAKEKKVSRMTRNGLVEENLATKETRKVTNSDQELSYKQKDVEQAFITSEKKKNSHKKAEKKQFSEKVQEGNPAKKERLQTVLRKTKNTGTVQISGQACRCICGFSGRNT